MSRRGERHPPFRQPPTANRQLPTANRQLPTANCQLPTPHEAEFVFRNVARAYDTIIEFFMAEPFLHDGGAVAFALRRRSRSAAARAMLGTLLLTAISCTATRGPLVVTDPDPSIKIPAIEKAVRTRDMSALPQLVKDLDSDDAAVRLYANHALEQLSGMNFGYRYFDDADQREPAAKKWRDWLSDPSGGQGKSAPASSRSTTGPS